MCNAIFGKIRAAYEIFCTLPFPVALQTVFNGAVGRKTLLKTNLNEYEFSFRTCSPDLRVALSSLRYGEYCGIMVERPKVIVDVGANIGTSSMWLANNYRDSMVIAIEPEKENFQLLQMNTLAFKNIRTLRAALGATSGQRTLFDRGTGPWGYTLSDMSGNGSTKNVAQESVRCVTIPEIMNMNSIDRIDILKIDIEGGEKEVFDRCEDWIDRVEMIVIELHDRIVPGCSASFAAATTDFKRRFESGEKVFAYRK